MNWLMDLLWQNDQFLGIASSYWKVIGWIGNAVFFSRFFVQWYATEKRREVTIPSAFWWLSLIGSLLLLAYGLSKHDSVFIFAYAFTWIPYIRNLMIHYRNKKARVSCECGSISADSAKFCSACGNKLS